MISASAGSSPSVSAGTPFVGDGQGTQCILAEAGDDLFDLGPALIGQRHLFAVQQDLGGA
jgi:hypothetical protein